MSSCRSYLPRTEFIRLKELLKPHGPIPISRSCWLAGVGAYPKPVKLGPRITAWSVEDIREFLANRDVG